jgi:hypothetical protein
LILLISGRLSAFQIHSKFHRISENIFLFSLNSNVKADKRPEISKIKGKVHNKIELLFIYHKITSVPAQMTA